METQKGAVAHHVRLCAVSCGASDSNALRNDATHSAIRALLRQII